VKPWVKQLGIGAGVLAGTWYALASPDVQRADVRVGDWMRRQSTPALDKAVMSTTDLGSAYAAAGIAAGLALTGRRRAAADVLGVGFVAWNLAQANKRFVRRARPYETDGVRRLIRPPTGSSFPSGHAALGVAVMTVLAERSRDGNGRRLLHALAAYVPMSRVYVGVHYPTDALGGAGLGLALAALWRGPIPAVSRAAVALGWRVAVPLLRTMAAGLPHQGKGLAEHRPSRLRDLLGDLPNRLTRWRIGIRQNDWHSPIGALAEYRIDRHLAKQLGAELGGQQLATARAEDRV